jgi:hypothetical protein
LLVARHTRISLRRFFVLITYIAVLVGLTVVGADSDAPSNPLCWVYYFGKMIPHDRIAWPYFVAATVLLIGTLPPFLSTRWWTIVPAVICGSLYVAIGYEMVLHKFLL